MHDLDAVYRRRARVARRHATTSSASACSPTTRAAGVHGARTTFVRVADVCRRALAPPVAWPRAAGEMRIVGAPVQPRSGRRTRARGRAWRRGRAAVGVLSRGSRAAGRAARRVTLRVAARGAARRGPRAGRRGAVRSAAVRAPVDRGSEHRRAGAGAPDVHRLPAADPYRCSRQWPTCSARSRVIRAFAPLPRTINPAVPTTGYDDVKRIALARLVVDNVPSIQVDWSLYGPKLAQVALTVGADDVDARVGRRRCRAEGRRRAPLEEIRRNIHAAGQEPVERNGRFDLHRLDDARPPGRGRLPQCPPAGLRARAVAAVRRCGSTCRRNARALLHAGEIDLGLIPSIEYLRGRRLSDRAGSGDRLARPGGVGGALHDASRCATCARSRWTRARGRRSRSCACCAPGCSRSSRPSTQRAAGSRARCSSEGDAALIIGDNALLLADRRCRRRHADRREDRSRRGVDEPDRAAVRLGVLGRARRRAGCQRTSRRSAARDAGVGAAARRSRARISRRRRRSRRSARATCAIISSTIWAPTNARASSCSIATRRESWRRSPAVRRRAAGRHR